MKFYKFTMVKRNFSEKVMRHNRVVSPGLTAQLAKSGKLKKSQLMLPDQPYHHDFLDTMLKIFHWSRWFGLFGPGPLMWKAWSLLVFTLLVTIEGGAIWKVIKALAGWAIDTEGQRSVTARLAGTMFYTSAILSLVFSSRLFLAWKSLSAFWVSIERMLYINLSPDLTLRKRMYRTIIVMGICSILEHFMSVISAIGLDCPTNLIPKRYVMKTHGFIFLRDQYSVWLAVPLFMMSIIATFLWNFQDALIVLLAMGLSSRYVRLNEYVAKLCAEVSKNTQEDSKTEVVKVYMWRKVREAYVKQAALVRKVDVYIGGIVLLSSFGNFYFICLQLFLCITQGLNGSAAKLRVIYYLVSLVWLVTRCTWMVLSASDVNAQSKNALGHLQECGSHSYNVEIDRLQNQLRKDYVALSGMGFYSLNRNILLKMAASVVTYELVLIQFDNKGSADH